MASTDELHVTVNSTGGHAALIDNKNNPIFIATKLINKLADYFEQKHSGDCLFSIGYFEAKGSTNVVPATVKLKGTFRSLDEDIREKSHRKMLKISNSLIKGKTCIDFNIIKGYPCLINDPFLTKKNISLAEKYLGKNNVVDLPIRMTAEDFSYFTQLVPSCFYRLGTANKKRNILSGLHTSTFDIDEESLKIGMGLMAFLAVKNIS